MASRAWRKGRSAGERLLFAGSSRAMAQSPPVDLPAAGCGWAVWRPPEKAGSPGAARAAIRPADLRLDQGSDRHLVGRRAGDRFKPRVRAPGDKRPDHLQIAGAGRVVQQAESLSGLVAHVELAAVDDRQGLSVLPGAYMGAGGVERIDLRRRGRGQKDGGQSGRGEPHHR